MTGPTVRRAVPDDAAQLARLRSDMFEAMGVDVSARGWLERCERHFANRIASSPDTFAAFVVDGVAPGRLAASGCGWLESHLPGPRNPTGIRGYVANMSTHPSARRRGYGRAILGALLEWFVDAEVTWVDLRSTHDAEPLYRSAGFEDPLHRALTWTKPER